MDETKKPEETVKPVDPSVELSADELKQVVGGTDAASPDAAASGKHISKAVLYVR
jgi:hypothetical protein